MQISVSSSSSSLVATLVTSQATFFVGANAAIASAVDFSYKSESILHEENEISKLGDECHFALPSSLRGSDADAGILRCTEPGYICVQDKLSYLGGRCTPFKMIHRDLQDTPACSFKCEGTDACKGLDQTFIDNYISDKSCCGTKACAYITGE